MRLSDLNIFYVYVYLDPRKPGDYNYGKYHFDYEPFYVGKGSNGRSNVHLSGNEDNKYFDNTIKKIQRICNTDPIIVKYQEMLLEQDSFDLEIKMIATIGRYDKKLGPLCNHTDGGTGGDTFTNNPNKEITRKRLSESSTGRVVSEETRIKIREKQLGVPRYYARGDLSPNKRPELREKQRLANIGEKNPMFNHIWTPVQLKNLSDSLMGHIVTDETRDKIRKTNTGKKLKIESIEKIKQARAKQVFSEDSKRKRIESYLKTVARRKAEREV